MRGFEGFMFEFLIQLDASNSVQTCVLFTFSPKSINLLLHDQPSIATQGVSLRSGTNEILAEYKANTKTVKLRAKVSELSISRRTLICLTCAINILREQFASPNNDYSICIHVCLIYKFWISGLHGCEI